MSTTTSVAPRASAVLRMARTHRGRPATQIHATLRSTDAPGCAPEPATLRELAADIAAGRPNCRDRVPCQNLDATGSTCRFGLQ
jgi:hypothetical protein